MYGTSSARSAAAIASLPHQVVGAAVSGFSSTAPLIDDCDTARSFVSIASLHLDSAVANHFAEALHVRADRFGEALGRSAERLVELREELLPQIRALQRLVDLGVEPRDHRRGCPARR